MECYKCTADERTFIMSIDLRFTIDDVPAGLIMQITGNSMRVCQKSNNTGNPYQEGASDSLGHGLYCGTVKIIFF